MSEEKGLPKPPTQSPGSLSPPPIFFARARFKPDPRVEFFRTGGSGMRVSYS